MKKKITAFILVFALALALGIGGTMAWLTDSTAEVVNTFTPSDISIGLTESENLDFKMVPGNDISKDPKVTVSTDSEDCWLFVKVEKSDNFDTFMEEPSIAVGWREVPSHGGFYYREVTVSGTAAENEFAVLAGNKVTVKKGVTKSEMNNLTENTQPTLTFTAAAVQRDNVTAVGDAWEKLPSAFTGEITAP